MDEISARNEASVSVVIATHEGRESLTSAVRSILLQRYEGSLECIVVFDQETPYAIEVDVPEGRTLRSLANNGTAGAAGARNFGAGASSGFWLGFCDDDDEWLTEKTERQLQALKESDGLEVATCGIEISHDGHEFSRIPSADRITAADLLGSRSMGVHLSTLFMKRDVFTARVGGFDESTPGSYGEDYDWLLRAVQHGPLVAVPEPLVRVRWGSSRFADRWATIIAGVTYLLSKHPELQQAPRNVARMYGRLAFAHAALHHRRAAWSWAGRALKSDRRQLRAYLAMLVAVQLVPAPVVVRALNRFGKGI